MKRAIYPLYAPADESRVKPILQTLREKGVALRREKPRKDDALVLFLSKKLSADSPVVDEFFRLNGDRALVEFQGDYDGLTRPGQAEKTRGRMKFSGLQY